jgi:hypothetical protein
MKQWSWRLLEGVCLCLVACLWVQAVAALQPPASQTSASALQVGPAIIEKVLTPGKATAFSVQVKNITNFPLPIKGFVRDMNPEAAKLPEAERKRLDASKWFTLADPDFILQPSQTRVVQGSVLAPVKVTPGGHYATIFFQPLVPDVALSPTMAYISARVGVLAFLVVKGDLKQELRLERPLATESLRRHGPVDFSFAIHNSGNVHMLPTGYLRVYNWRGSEVAKLALSPGVVLPGTTKPYVLQWKTDDLVGVYSAQLDLLYGDDRSVLQSKLDRFWVVPWIEALVVVGVVAAWLALRHKTKRRWGKAWRAFSGR